MPAQNRSNNGRDVDVLVVGGGPVGLALGILLERFGITFAIVEQSETTTDHPKARGCWPRTMEIFRQWGVEEAIRRRGLPDDADVFAFVETVSGEEFGRTNPEVNLGQTPAWKSIVSQDVVEEELLKVVQRAKNGRIFYDTEFVSCTDSSNGVLATTRSMKTGEVVHWSARYLIGADGAASLVRRQAGIEMSGPSALAVMANDYWSADLSPVLRSRQVAGYIVMTGKPGIPDSTILNTNGRDRWLTLTRVGIERDERDPPWSDDKVIEIARAQTGLPDLDITIINRSIWRLTRQVACNFRKGNVFLAGDAAHRFPPYGGFGMNSGIQDAHNLVWKLKFVLTGVANDGLLDTYDTERRPVAESNADWSYGNTLRSTHTSKAFPARNPDQMKFWIKDRENHLHNMGQGLGFTYEAGAIVSDGTVKIPVQPRHYEPSDRPGGRFPHLWLDVARKHSTLDLFDQRFVLMTGPLADSWQEAARVVSAKGNVPIDAVRLDSVDESQGLRMGPRGAVLVRPDGHVAFRMAWTPPDPARTLFESLQSVLSNDS